jgi:hypothetical protein
MESESSEIGLDNKAESGDIDYSKISLLKIIKVLLVAFILNLVFSTILYFFFYTQISNAITYIDFFYFGLASMTTAGYGDMAPKTSAAKTFISLYLIFIFSFMVSIAL